MFPLKYLIIFIFIKLCINQPQCPIFNPNVPPIFFPHEYDCTLFYRCEESGPVLMQCWPPGTHWSTETNRCEWAANANCNLPGSPTPPTTTTTTSTTSTSTSTTVSLTTTSTTLPPTTTSTTTTLPPTTTSTSSTSTIPSTTSTTTITLSTSTAFSPTPPVPSTTLSTSTIPITTSTTLSTSTILTTTLPPGPCPPSDDPNNIIFVEDPDDCSAYFMCFMGQQVRRQCEAPLLWNREQSWCDFPSNTDCRICPLIDDPNRLIFFPHASDCTRYYLCFNGNKLERQCQMNLFWDDRSSWCDVAGNVLCT